MRPHSDLPMLMYWIGCLGLCFSCCPNPPSARCIQQGGQTHEAIRKEPFGQDIGGETASSPNREPLLIVYHRAGDAHLAVAAEDDRDRNELETVIGADGTIIWSGNPTGRGKPFYVSRVGEARMAFLQRRVTELIGANEELGMKSYVVPDAGATIMRLTSGASRLELASCHEGFEQNPLLVADDHGKRVLNEGETREDLLSRATKELRDFRSAWSKMREAVREMMPTDGAPLGELPADIRASMRG